MPLTSKRFSVESTPEETLPTLDSNVLPEKPDIPEISTIESQDSNQIPEIQSNQLSTDTNNLRTEEEIPSIPSNLISDTVPSNANGDIPTIPSITLPDSTNIKTAADIPTMPSNYLGDGKKKELPPVNDRKSPRGVPLGFTKLPFFGNKDADGSKETARDIPWKVELLFS